MAAASQNPQQVVRTRFAPSPSGHLHVGGARTALFCWAFAKKHQGRFLLRIEDTDAKRSSDSASMAFLEDLNWLGIKWDEGPEYEGCGGPPPTSEHLDQATPFFQSQRLHIYNRYIDRLIEHGKAYRAFETPEELDAARKLARAEKRNYKYDRASLAISPGVLERYVSEGRPHVVRFKVPNIESVTVHDEVRGEVVVMASELDDFVIRKADGFPTYHFAVVIDDELMGVTHVIRAQEHLSNTPRHVLLQDALGFRRPVYAHISLITNPDGSKMSKRDKDKALRAAVKQRQLKTPPQSPGIPMPGLPAIDDQTWQWWLSDSDHQLDLHDAEKLAQALHINLPEINVDDFRRQGYLPEVMVNYLALLGWSPGNDIEKFDRQFLIEHFDFDRVIKTPAKFDREKLLAFNNDAIQSMSPEEFEQRLRDHCERYHPEFIERLSSAQFSMLARANQARSKTLESQIGSSRFFILRDDEIEFDPKAVQDVLVKGQPSGYEHLHALLPLLKVVDEWTSSTIERVIKTYASEYGGQKGLGKIAQPLRVAVSGTTVSPAIFDTLAILGKASALVRMNRCLLHMSQLGAIVESVESLLKKQVR